MKHNLWRIDRWAPRAPRPAPEGEGHREACAEKATKLLPGSERAIVEGLHLRYELLSLQKKTHDQEVFRDEMSTGVYIGFLATASA